MKTNYIITIIIACGSMALLPSHAQRVKVIDGYAAISAEGYTQGVESDESFEDVPLDGTTKTVKRKARHIKKTNTHISPLFAIAPTDINIGGSAANSKVEMTWAEAGGFHLNANTTGVGTSQPAMKTGCPEYKGKDGNDNSGTWRLPTYKELRLMNILKTVVENTSDTGFQPYIQSRAYWSSTEQTAAGEVYTIVITGFGGNGGGGKGSNYPARCVKDLPAP